MNFRQLSATDQKEMAGLMFQKLNSAQELKDWILTFLDLDMPIHTVDPESNSSPIDAMWEIYNTIRLNKGDEIPGYIMLSARECYKTLGASILETLLMCHFRVTIAHMAAIQAQSAKAIQYINYFFNKLDPLLESVGWQKTSENKSRISYRTEDGVDVYIRVIVATMAGANSEHTSLMFIDEIDVVANPLAYEEAKLIPGFDKGIYPVTVKLSTRKFAFGLMQKEIDLAPISGDKIVRWNIIDVTERCPETRHKPELPKAEAFIAKSLPLRQITREEYESLADAEKDRWEHLPEVHGGCTTCPLLAVCKTRLSKRGPEATGGLYKPISVVINNFKKTNPDMAEAQLMCWKPSSKGLVYPRFEGTVNSGNVITVSKAFETLVGGDKKHVRFDDLVNVMRTLKIPFYAGVDWGYTHDFVIVIFAKMPNGEMWVVDCYSAPGLEFADCLEIAKSYRDKYHPEKWYCDQAMPSHTKSFNKNGMRSPKFTKDVMGGIEALRSKIIDGYGRRLLKVVLTDATSKVITSFGKHHFKLDGQGNPTLVPDDTPGVADQADAMRYVGQNLFPVKGPQKPMSELTEEQKRQLGINPEAGEQLREEIYKRVETIGVVGGSGKKGGFHFIF